MKQEIQLQANLKHDEESIQVAFCVVSHNTFGSENSNVPYEVVYINVGNGWNPTANVFQAFVAGVYQFSASMRSNGNSMAKCHIVHTPAEAGANPG